MPLANVSGQLIGPIFKGQLVQRPLKMGPIGCPVTSVWNCRSLLRNIAEECSSSKYDCLVSVPELAKPEADNLFPSRTHRTANKSEWRPFCVREVIICSETDCEFIVKIQIG